MKNQVSFVRMLFSTLAGVFPFALILAIAFASMRANGSWARFFDEALLTSLIWVAGIWLFMGFYAAYYRYKTGASIQYVRGDDEADTGSVGFETNPATGLPTIGGAGTNDVGGHSWGRND